MQAEIGIQIEFVSIHADGTLDMSDFQQKYTSDVKLIACSHISNMTGTIVDVEAIGKLKRNDTIFLVDGSQSIPHIAVDIEKINGDFFVCTAHKLFADTGLGIIWAKKELLETFNPVFSGGGAILEVNESGFQKAGLPYTFEPGTPHISGAISLLRALEYIEQNGGMEEIQNMEVPLIEYTLENFAKRSYIRLFGAKTAQNRVGVFSFVIDGVHAHDIADILAQHQICVRAGKHCAEPLAKFFGIQYSVRMSLGVYNTVADIDAFFRVLDDNFS